MLLSLKEAGLTVEQIANGVFSGKLIPLIKESMDKQTYLAPYIATGKDYPAILAISRTLIQGWQAFTVFTNVKQFDGFVGLSQDEMAKVCNLIIKLRKTKLKEAMEWKQEMP